MIMKTLKTLSFILLVSLQFSAFSQNNFEGILTFKFEFEDKKGMMTAEQIKQFIGDKQVYYLKDEKYKSEMNGLLEIKTFHEGKDTLFTQMKGTNALQYILTNVADEEVISYEFKKTAIKVLEYTCDLLEVKTNKGTHKYYYNKDLKMDPSVYKNHKIGLWSFFTEKTGGALSIISISETDDLKTKIELISVDRKKLENAIFIKPNSPIVPMPEN